MGQLTETVAVEAQRNRMPLVALLTANVVSTVGNIFTTISVPWFVLETTGSPTMTGIAGAVTALSFVASFFGGTLVDRIGFKRVAVAGDLASGIAIALVPLLYHTVSLEFWQLLALIFLRALFNTPGNTARLGLLPELITLAGASKDRVNGIYQATINGATLIGTALTGILIALVGTSNTLWLDAASFLVSATLVSLAVPASLQPVSPASRPSYCRELVAGWQFLVQDRLLWGMAVLAALVNFIGAALFAVILPVYALEVYGTSVSLGALFAGASAGTLIGSVCYTAVAVRLSRYRLLMIGVALLSAVFWLLAPFPALIVAVVAVGLRGIATGLVAPIFGVVQQERVPFTLRGRVFGTSQALGTLAIPLGTVLAGYGVSLFGLHGALVSMGALTLVATLWAVTNRALREMNTIKAS
jgi:MFS family permease